MRILLAQSTVYVPTHGGENKANRLLVEGLAARGHQCRVVSPACGAQGPGARTQFLNELAARSLRVVASTPEGDVFEQNGVAVHAVARSARLRQALLEEIAGFEPDVILISSEDPGHVLLEAAVTAAPHRVVYLAHTMLFFPFGPHSFFANAAKTALLQRAAGVITVSRYLREYIRQYGGCDSVVIPFPVYGEGPFPACADFDGGRVTLINACTYKGLPIFLELARRHPEARFLAVASWGTTAADRAALGELPNVEVIEPVDDIDRLFALTRILIVPSLWAEGFPLVPVEAMLRGVPVIASDSGGLPESKLGVDYVVPVRPIERYTTTFDDRRLPVAVVEPQDIAPWDRVLSRLLSDRDHHAELSRLSRAAASAYVASLSVEPFERYFAEIVAATPAVHATDRDASSTPATARTPAGDRTPALEHLSPERRALLALKLKQRKAAQRIPARPRSAGEQRFPLSFAQERLWFLEQWQPGNAAYNNVDAFRLTGTVDRAALQRAITELVGRHETLRTRVAVEAGQPVQIVMPAAEEFAIAERAAPHRLSDRDREEWLRRSLVEEIERPFDIGTEPLFRATILRLNDADCVLVLVAHHLVSDGWSGGLIFSEIAALYSQIVTGRRAELPALAVQYGDFAAWQRASLHGEALDGHIRYWTAQLADAPALLELPLDRPRPPVQSFRGDRAAATLSPAATKAIKDLARAEGVTLFMTLLAAFDIVLHRYTGQSDIVVGSVVAGRNRSELEPLVGFFANTLPLRTDLSGDPTTRELLRRVRDVAVQAYAHQDLPFARLVQALQPDRTVSHDPVFQVAFVLQNTPRDAFDLTGVAIRPLAVRTRTAKFDLTLDATEREDAIELAIEYRTDLFDATTIDRLLGHLQMVLEGMVRNPDQPIARLPLLTSGERRQILVDWNDTDAAWPADATIHALFEEQVRLRPDAVAVECGDVSLTYAELDKRANRLAWRLRARGVGPESLVAVCMEKTADVITVLLGILKAGGAYVPVDPAYPDDRIAFTLEDCEARIVVTDAEQVARMAALRLSATAAAPEPIIASDLWAHGEDAREDAPPAAASAENLCYVIYTSGSTGRPKGVLIEHRNVVRLLVNDRFPFEFSERDVWTVFHSFSFDFSVWEMYGALLFGGKLIVVPREVAQQPAEFLDLLENRGVTVLNQVPSAFYALMQTALARPAADLELRYIIFGGEALQPALLKEWKARYPKPLLVNMFGITETTVHVTFRIIGDAEIDAGVSVIGWPIPTLTMYVLDDARQLVPVGVRGELCVGGAGVARGYLKRPELTAERFVPHPFRAGDRLYRSGDVGRIRPNGEIEYLGRRDAQVKLRGFRIELGEIEAVLSAHPAVRECVVMAREDVPGDRRLVAYYTDAAGQSAAPAELRRVLLDRLPDYMVPAAIVRLDAMPTTASGKVDRKKLPAPTAAAIDAERPYVAPRTETEARLASIWADVLGLERLGLTDNFFDVGGHSLLATRLIGRMQDAFKVAVPLRTVFEHPTVAELAAAVDNASTSGPAAPPAIVAISRRPRSGRPVAAES